MVKYSLKEKANVPVLVREEGEETNFLPKHSSLEMGKKFYLCNFLDKEGNSYNLKENTETEIDLFLDPENKKNYTYLLDLHNSYLNTSYFFSKPTKPGCFIVNFTNILLYTSYIKDEYFYTSYFGSNYCYRMQNFSLHFSGSSNLLGSSFYFNLPIPIQSEQKLTFQDTGNLFEQTSFKSEKGIIELPIADFTVIEESFTLLVSEGVSIELYRDKKCLHIL